MANWIDFPLYASLAAVMWLLALSMLYAFPQKWSKTLSVALGLTGVGLLGVFITFLWHELGRPPMRTLGETRLWYATFLPLIGLITYLRWGYRWFLAYSYVLAVVFLGINWLKPDTYTKELMPALQSPWFVPHVVVYMLAYALLAASSLVGVRGLWERQTNRSTDNTITLADNIVYAGFAFLTLGLLFGALWAKEAWGHYWTWDPKEIWALLTWLVYLVYIHLRHYHPSRINLHLWTLALAFIILLVCWFGINYLPSAQNSVHVYSN